jgi:AcrR family transcriptional regulator
MSWNADDGAIRRARLDSGLTLTIRLIVLPHGKHMPDRVAKSRRKIDRSYPVARVSSMAMPATNSADPPAKGISDARERLIAAAYELFSRRGVQAVGVDTIIERSGVARQTMYRHFGSKQDLVLAFLERRDQIWTRDWLQATVERATADPRARLLAIFDAFDVWFHEPGFEGCSFINVMLEHPDPEHPVHRASAAYLAGIRHFVEDLARRAGIADAEGFARKWHLLMKGSIVSAGEGDVEAARRARRLGELLLADGGSALTRNGRDGTRGKRVARTT